MKLSAALLLLPSTILATPVSTSQASFASLLGLTTLTHDHSAPLRHESKFFNEAKFHPHYDGRFASSTLPQQSRTVHLRLLVKTYMETMARIGVRTWIMHGSLLGWWWNGSILTWDSDVDVMVEESGILELGEWWGLSVHPFTAKELGLLVGDEKNDDMLGLKKEDWDTLQKHGKKYLLEINPHHVNHDTRDKFNVIDARWIDTSTGLFIDITTVHTSPRNDGEMFTKDAHAYDHSQLFPLRQTTFEGVEVLVPYAYEELLHEEYGPGALTRTKLHGYKFDGKAWVDTGFTGRQELMSGGGKRRGKNGIVGERAA
ncbi:hypothetical protein P153DRAFT_370943 [Dothidotthia symphoricarpi CBS 119687]|uniref:LicD/FKTN/FKRP nucleotidyltransferase domain-containing protein n=1 Tax=Dothidotthia symphoricarpi CBS 119687 TaxID=1392245 RepID=A0A6A6A1U7_9PLEO|nr:uncharacterized protein P153DRAFT_370943 [Dothidotthia symphoricarpi CBS 119687]KAF2124541.1 hypothetical protein P153DRAFT_370943 [Dothidotthia symphoricarpi CBS 119687]